MNADRAEVTPAALAIRRREDGQKRITMAAVPLFGLIMAASAVPAFLTGAVPGVGGMAAAALSALFYLLSFSCLGASPWTIGMIPQAGVGAYFFCLSVLLPWVRQSDLPVVRIFFTAVFAAAGVVVAYILCVLGVMLCGSFSLGKRGEYTLMVLGCRLKNGRPGRMLQRRLRKAAAVLGREPELMCVVSGGRAPDQPCAEAEAMAEYLCSLGVPQHRIIVENRSSTTYENFLFSGGLLEEKGLPPRVGVVTDRFHQFRSGRIARSAGIDSFPISCGTVWYLAVQFWMRDMLCITERLLRGHW